MTDQTIGGIVMIVHINSTSDISDFMENFVTDTTMQDLKYIYKLPGYRSYIHLGEFKDIIFLEILINRTIRFQMEWVYPIDLFVDKANEFGFISSFTVGDSPTTYLRFPPDFNIQEENLFIEELLNFVIRKRNNEYMKYKYGLR